MSQADLLLGETVHLSLQKTSASLKLHFIKIDDFDLATTKSEEAILHLVDIGD